MHIRPIGISELDHFFWKVGGGGRGRASPPDFQNLIISINYLTSYHKYKYIWIWILIDANIELLAAWMSWKERNNRVLQRRATQWFTPWSSLPTWGQEDFDEAIQWNLAGYKHLETWLLVWLGIKELQEFTL